LRLISFTTCGSPSGLPIRIFDLGEELPEKLRLSGTWNNSDPGAYSHAFEGKGLEEDGVTQ